MGQVQTHQALIHSQHLMSSTREVLETVAKTDNIDEDTRKRARCAAEAITTAWNAIDGMKHRTQQASFNQMYNSPGFQGNQAYGPPFSGFQGYMPTQGINIGAMQAGNTPYHMQYAPGQNHF